MNLPPTRRISAASAWNVLKIVLAVVLILFVLSKVDFPVMIAALKGASFFWLAITLLTFLTLTLLKAVQYYVLVGDQLTYSQVLSVIILQNAVSNYLASGAGVASYFVSFQLEHGVKISRSMVIFLLIKIGDLTAIWLGLFVTSFLVWPQIGMFIIPVAGLLLGIGLIIVVFLFTIFHRRKSVSFMGAIMDRLKLSHLRMVGRGMELLKSLAEIDQEMMSNKLLLTFLLSCAYFVITMVFSYANLMIFGLDLEIQAVVFVNVILQLVSYIPIQVFGGLGVAETGALYFWSFFDVSQQALTPAYIGIRIVFYLMNLVPLLYLFLYTSFKKYSRNAGNF